MQYTTLADLERFLRWLLTPGEGLELLRASLSGRLYEPRFRRFLTELESLPDALVRRAFVDELTRADDLHDLLGAAIWLITGGLAQLPLLAEEHRKMASLLRERMLVSPADLRRSYEDEANAAHAQRALVQANEEKLRAVQVAPGVTWYELLDAFVRTGEEIGGLLGQRAAAELDSRAKAQRLRAQLMGSFSRLRGALTDELEDDPALPRDLADRLFAALDQAAANRYRRGVASGSSTSTTGASPEGPAADPPLPD